MEDLETLRVLIVDIQPAGSIYVEGNRHSKRPGGCTRREHGQKLTGWSKHHDRITLKHVQMPERIERDITRCAELISGAGQRKRASLSISADQPQHLRIALDRGNLPVRPDSEANGQVAATGKRPSTRRRG